MLTTHPSDPLTAIATGESKRGTRAVERFTPAGGAALLLEGRVALIGTPPATIITRTTIITVTMRRTAHASKRRRRPLRRASLMSSSAASEISKETSCRGGEIVIEFVLIK